MFARVLSPIAIITLVLTLLVSTIAATQAQAAVDTKTTAVIIIDMQGGFYNRGGTRGTPGLEALVKAQQELLAWAVANDVPVIFFEYRDYNVTNTRLTDVLLGHTHEVIIKETDGAFDNNLSGIPAKDALTRWGSTNLIISGINGNACVYSTVMGALREGFHVITSADIVGDLNVNPPIYPNGTWFPYGQKNLTVANSLSEILF